MQVRFSHNIEKSLHSVSKKKLYSLHCRSRDCKLFAARDIAEWERQMAEMQPERQMRIAARPTGATVRCPKFRARNFKVTAALSLSLCRELLNLGCRINVTMRSIFLLCTGRREVYLLLGLPGQLLHSMQAEGQQQEVRALRVTGMHGA